MTLQVLENLYTHATDRSEQIAIQEISREGIVDWSVTFAELLRYVQAYAETVRTHVSPGDVVIVHLSNQVHCTAAFLGTLHAGAIGFLINPAATAHELKRAAHVSGAKAIFAPGAALEPLGDLNLLTLPLLGSNSPRSRRMDAPSSPERSGLMLLSSGTTADPKIVMRSGISLDAVARNVATATALREEDIVLGMIPLCHSYGVEHGILAPTYAGACVHLCNGFETHMIRSALRNGSVTVFPGVPSIFEMLAASNETRTNDQSPSAFPALRCAYSAGSSIPMSVIDACRQNLGLRVGQLYGSSEVGSVTFNDPHAPDYDPMSVGVGMQGVNIKILDESCPKMDNPLPPGVEGELVISSPSMLLEYVGGNDDEKNSPLIDGYFRTGDLARQAPDGAVTITGRIKLLIDVGALKVNPIEVESVLTSHDGVKDCLVMSIPVTETISRVRALVVPADMQSAPSAESLRQYARTRLSQHKVPRVIDIVKTLPKSPTGKILRRQIAS